MVEIRHFSFHDNKQFLIHYFEIFYVLLIIAGSLLSIYTSAFHMHFSRFSSNSLDPLIQIYKWKFIRAIQYSKISCTSAKTTLIIKNCTNVSENIIMNHYFFFVILHIFKYNNVSSIPDANIHIIFYRIHSIVRSTKLFRIFELSWI